MNRLQPFGPFVCALWISAVALTEVPSNAVGSDFILYQTGFEVEEGFEEGFTIVQQGGWLGTAVEGNGLTSGFIEESGQHAYIGFNPPSDAPAFLNIFKPIDYAPPVQSQSIVQYSVRMKIVTSTEGQNNDDFRWSVYNTDEERLFTLNFETETLGISYVLHDSAEFIPTGLAYDLVDSYGLDIWMDFDRNLWTALLNDVVVVNSQPIATSNSALTLGDVDAVWAIQSPGSPGDNFMVFDNYRVAVVDVPSVPPTTEAWGIGTNGAFILRVYGQAGLNYLVEATGDWKTWEMVGTFQAPSGGTFDVEDPQVNQTSHRFFRVSQVP